MTYQQLLHPWCIVRFLPNLQQRVIARFRRRNDAEAHLRILRQQAPMLQYVIVFEPVAASPLNHDTGSQDWDSMDCI